MKTLIIVAHPDDEVLGCGGTIARMAQEGNEVYIAIMGEGITSRYDRTELAPQKLIKELHQCSLRVAKHLGAKDLFIHNLPDNRFDTVPLLEIVKYIEKLLQELNPKIVYTHHGGDLNIDHTIVHRAVLTASRPLANQSVKTIYTFEIPSSTDWAFGKLPPVFQPNTFVAIDQYLNIKVQAMQIYDTESRSFPHPRSPEALESAALRWGSIAGMRAAEAFELVRKLEV